MSLLTLMHFENTRVRINFYWLFLISISLSWIVMGSFGLPSPYELSLLSGGLVSLFVLFVLVIGSGLTRIGFSVLVLLMAFSFWVITVGNWWHFSFFKSYFNYEFLRYGFDAGAAVFSIFAFPYLVQSIMLFSVLSAMGIGAIVTKPAQLSRRVRVTVLSMVLVLFVSGMAKHSSSLVYYRQQNMVTLAPSLFHPVHAFFYRTEKLQISDTEGELAEGYFRNLITSKTVANEYGLASPNVIIITLESIRADMTGFWGGTALTPNLDAFAKNNISVTNFYANTNYTVKGETAIWCGIFDHSVKPSIAKYSDQISNLNCLPKLLRDEAGYSTKYYHANSSSFYSRLKYLPLVGFDSLFFYADQFPAEHQSNKLGWGVSDGFMYDLILNDLQNTKQPFFASFMTISSHFPFQWEWDLPVPNGHASQGDQDVLKGYENAVSYVDQQLGRFLSQFMASPLAKNTILIITADHGVWVFDDEQLKRSEAQLNEGFFRLPFAMYIPSARSNYQELDIVASQIDIFPTLAQLLSLDVSNLGLVGNDIFRIDEGNGYSISMRSGSATVRIDDSVCFFAASECSGLHQNCASWNPQDIIDSENGSLQQCYKFIDDNLASIRLEQVEPQDLRVENAMKLIAYQNKKVFSGKAVRLDEADESPGQQVHH